MHKILIIFGTRPELIKLAPIIAEFRERNLRERLYIVYTKQHEYLIKEDMRFFEIDVDYQFVLNRKDDSLSLLNGLLLIEFDKLKKQLNQTDIVVDAIIAQGDTCTSFASSQFSFYERIPFIHIEAGLRTGDLSQPFPEEYYRKTISSIASFHFAPTPSAKQKLIKEGIDKNTIVVTGNTVIDNLRKYYNSQNFQNANNNLVLITIHRRENIKNNLQSIIKRVIYYCNKNPNKNFLWIDNPGYKIESKIGVHLDNLKLMKPISFLDIIEIYSKTLLVITDSGGIQEEAGYLGIPVLLFRQKTERTEGNFIGISKCIKDNDIDLDLIIEGLNQNRQNNFNTLYGDGYASRKIVDFIIKKGF